MRVLMVGDVVCCVGCEALSKHLRNLKSTYNIDVAVVNGENSADGNGITIQSCESIFESGADIITTGNHVYRRNEFHSRLDSDDCVLRPANFSKNAPGKGVCIYDMGKNKLCVINLSGNSFMEQCDNAFYTVDEILKEIDTKYILVDFHAEATGEKGAMAYYLDGRVSAVVGTHTHVQTADSRILPGGTGFITDVGMTGPQFSVLGVKPENIIARLKSQVPVKFETPSTPPILNAVAIEINDSGICTEIVPISIMD